MEVEMLLNFKHLQKISMINLQMVLVYIMLLEYFYDDYKRSDSYSYVEGIQRDKYDAYRTILRIEFFRNTEDGEKEPKKYEEFFKNQTV